jgi:hypothetical protein
MAFIISERGIEANPKKIYAITNMSDSRFGRGIASHRCLAVLSRFISCLKERGLPLYRLLRKMDCFAYTPEAQEALDGLKALLTKSPILVPPTKGEPLLLYVMATTQVVSAAIVVE